jgi:hypothetical protein
METRKLSSYMMIIIIIFATSVVALSMSSYIPQAHGFCWEYIFGPICNESEPVACKIILIGDVPCSDYFPGLRLDTRGTGQPIHIPTYVPENFFDPWTHQTWIYPDANVPGTIPLYEYVSPYDPSSERVQFYYTVTLNNQGLQAQGYRLVGIAGYVHTEHPGGLAESETVPLNRYVNLVTGNHIITTLRADDNYAFYGYQFDGHVGKVYDRPMYGYGLVPLFHYVIDDKYDFYSIHPTEIDQFSTHK